MNLEVVARPELSRRTTLRLGGHALAEVSAECPEDLAELSETLKRLGGEPFVLGGGSNILAQDGELPLVLVKPVFRDRPRIVTENGAWAVVRAGAGLRLPGLLGWLASRGLSGLEGLTGIPGSLGGAVAMNAGSYDSEMAERINAVNVFIPGRGVVRLGPEGFEVGYRRFRPRGVEGFFLVTSVELRLDRDEAETVRGRMRDTYLRKKQSQPVLAHTAGCVFKNPATGISAGKLMDEAGLKGFRLGGMGFSGMHANFLVNHGQGTSAQALELLDMARERVRRASGYDLELEVRVCPCN